MEDALLRPFNVRSRIRRNASVTLTIAASVLLLSGCAANDESENDAAATGLPAASTSTKLSPLNENDIASNPLEGELICAFSVGRNTLLYAAGNAATEGDSDAIVKFGDQVMRVSAPGGFDIMMHGTSFKGERLVVEVKLAEHVEQPEKAGSNGASSYPPSTLTYIRNTSPIRSVEGRWECGP